MPLLEDAGHGGMKTAEVEEVKDIMTGIEAMKGIMIGMKKDVRKEVRITFDGSHRNQLNRPITRSRMRTAIPRCS